MITYVVCYECKEKEMKKIILTLLISILAFSAFALNETSTLKISTAIDQKNVISFKDSSNDNISVVNLNSVDSVNVKVSLWTNKATGNLPTVKLVAKPLVNADNSQAFISYTVNGEAVNGSEKVISENLYTGLQISGNEAKDYFKDLAINIDADSKAEALVGSYNGTLTVTVMAD